jgi:hypothetical protein
MPVLPANHHEIRSPTNVDTWWQRGKHLELTSTHCPTDWLSSSLPAAVLHATTAQYVHRGRGQLRACYPNAIACWSLETELLTELQGEESFLRNQRSKIGSERLIIVKSILKGSDDGVMHFEESCFRTVSVVQWSRVSSVSIVSDYWLDDRAIRGSIPGRGKGFFF